MSKYEWSEKADQRRKERRPVPIKKIYKIKAATKKRAKQLRKYSKQNKKFLEDQVCQFPGCESKEVTNHHGAGRKGEQLLNFKDSKILCWPHHKWCEDNPQEAKKLNLSLNRLNNE